MKIIYLTDIHGAFNQVLALLIETIADVYIITGDLIDIPFYGIESAIHYHDLQSYFTGMRRNMEMEDMIIEDFVDKLLEIPDTPDYLQDMGSKYQQYTIRARRVMQQKYKVLENIFLTKPSSQIYSLPGNYDMDLKFTSLHERDLHLRWHDLSGFKIAGYGGADVWTMGIPEKYIINYNAGIGTDDKKNEMYIFFKAIRPDIIVTHQPAHGVMDRHIVRGTSGSPALRTFCDTNPVQLCLSGHMHNDWGLRFVEDTVYLNPSNFGDITSTSVEVTEGGYFFEIEMNDRGPEKILYKKFANERIFELAEYYKKDNEWVEDVKDLERYSAHKRGENYDLKVQKYSHIPEIELFKDIKSFFRTFQTQETEERVKELEVAMELLNNRLVDVALDIAGSVNLGISQKSSDIDVVLYTGCKMECPDLHEQCPHFRDVKRQIEESLAGRYRFEIVDCIDIDLVRTSILMEDYECEVTQRFVAYRSICRPVNYKVIAPIEDLLNRNIEFRKELEGSIRSYFKIFVTTSQHTKSFEKYEARLKTIGIKMPSFIKKKIQEYLQQENPE
jgi:Icc-related predicted phosphoesterase